MVNKINKRVADVLVGKKIKKVLLTDKGAIFIFDDGSNLLIVNGIVTAPGGGLTSQTVFTLNVPPVELFRIM